MFGLIQGGNSCPNRLCCCTVSSKVETAVPIGSAAARSHPRWKQLSQSALLLHGLIQGGNSCPNRLCCCTVSSKVETAVPIGSAAARKASIRIPHPHPKLTACLLPYNPIIPIYQYNLLSQSYHIYLNRYITNVCGISLIKSLSCERNNLLKLYGSMTELFHTIQSALYRL